MIHLTTISAWADSIYGIGHCTWGAWDFSDSCSVGLYEGDFRIVYVADPPIGFVMCASTGALVTVSDSSFSELTTAPADLTLYEIFLPAIIDVTYVILTVEGHFAKFRLYLHYPAPTFEYVYQPDVTLNFNNQVPVNVSTWGRIKAIYAE